MTQTTHDMVLPRKRRTTRRGAETRVKILEAAISCIITNGYGATTIEHILTESGISRGSVLYQFPTRLDLTVSIAKRAMLTLMNDCKHLLWTKKDPFERVCSLADVIWETQSRPAGLALTEILLATRWDKELAEALRPSIEAMDQEVEHELRSIAGAAGFRQPEKLVPHAWVIMTSIRGLLLEQRIAAQRTMFQSAATLITEQHKQFCNSLPRASKISQA